MLPGLRGADIRSRWRSRRKMSVGQRVVIVLAVLALAAALIGVVAHYRAPGSLYTLALAAFSPYLVLCSVLAGVLFALVRTRAGWIGLAASFVVIAWFVVLTVPTYVAETAPPAGVDVVVMTANLEIGGADPGAVVAAVRTHHVDALMLEELTPAVRDALRQAGLDAMLPHSVVDPHDAGGGTGLWSRFPLDDTATRDDLGFAFISAGIDVAGKRATLVALHVYGPSPQPQFARWQSDMHAFPTLLRDLPGPVVLVGGDFNATPDTAQFRTILDQGFADGAVQAGAGFTPTWPADRWFPPLITIDHVLTRGAVARSADTIEIPGTDHRALVVSVRVPSS